MTENDVNEKMTAEEREQAAENRRQWKAITAPVIAAAREWRSLQHRDNVRRADHMQAEMRLAEAIDTYNTEALRLGKEQDVFVKRVVNRIKNEK